MSGEGCSEVGCAMMGRVEFDERLSTRGGRGIRKKNEWIERDAVTAVSHRRATLALRALLLRGSREGGRFSSVLEGLAADKL